MYPGPPPFYISKYTTGAQGHSQKFVLGGIKVFGGG